jgi:hypothetical protein
MDFIELDQMVVPAEKNGTMWVVVNEVVGSPLPHAADEDGRDVTLGPATLPGKVTVLDKMPARLKSLAIPAAERHAVISSVKDVAA